MDLIALLFGYSIQIFADFAGYSLISIGLAGLFGYKFNENFLFPYISSSFSEFWQRWHISLSSFLKEYLYIPLGGNRLGKYRTYLNLLITMLLGGLWHGAAWSYLAWGGYHGVALVIERYFAGVFSIKMAINLRLLKGLLVFTVVTFGWLFFKLPHFSEAYQYIVKMFTSSFYSKDKEKIILIIIYSIPVISYHFLYLIRLRIPFTFKKYGYPVMYGALLFFIMVNSGSSGSFIYFQF